MAMTLLGSIVAGCAGAAPSPAAQPADADPVVITLVAEDIAFTPDAIGAPAGSDLVVRLENRDAGIPHNVALMGDAGGSTKLGASDIVSGPAFADLLVPGLVPGRYQFICEVHPPMTATLTVGG